MVVGVLLRCLYVDGINTGKCDSGSDEDGDDGGDDDDDDDGDDDSDDGDGGDDDDDDGGDDDDDGDGDGDDDGGGDDRGNNETATLHFRKASPYGKLLFYT